LREAQQFREKMQSKPVGLGSELAEKTLTQIKQVQLQKKILLKQNEIFQKRILQLE